MKRIFHTHSKKVCFMLLAVAVVCLFAASAIAMEEEYHSRFNDGWDSFGTVSGRGAGSTSSRGSVSFQEVPGNNSASNNYNSIRQDGAGIRNDRFTDIAGNRGRDASISPFSSKRINAETESTAEESNRNMNAGRIGKSNSAAGYSNSDYAKIFEKSVKVDIYFKKDFENKASFAEKVGDLYLDWVLEKQLLEATGKTEELYELNVEKEAELDVLKAENKANEYGLEELLSEDQTSSDAEMTAAWQKARDASSDYNNASEAKGTQAANDTYWKNYYTVQAKKDADKEADAAAKNDAFRRYLAGSRGLYGRVRY